MSDLYDQVLLPALNLAETDRHKGKIDEARQKFLFLEMRELVSEIEDEHPSPEATSPGRVVCVPANDQADEIAASMLAQLVRRTGVQAVLGRVRSLARLSIGPNDVICVSALPPFAFTHGKEMHHRLRTRFPRSKIVMGLWGFPGDLEKAAQRFGRERPERLCTTLQEALQAVADPVSTDTSPAPSAEPTFQAETSL